MRFSGKEYYTVTLACYFFTFMMAVIFVNTSITQKSDGVYVRIDPLYEFIGFAGSISLPMMIYVLPGYFFYRQRKLLGNKKDKYMILAYCYAFSGVLTMMCYTWLCTSCMLEKLKYV